VKISLRKNSGMALIIAMIAVTVLSMLAAGLWYAMKVETRLAQNADSETQLYWLGRSGVEYARWILSQELAVAGEPYDALNQKWAGGPGSDAESNSALAGISLDNYPVGDGTVSLKIIDLERKINVNTAGPDVLQQALTAMGVDADSISVVSDSIQDWINPDAAPRLAGAESDYYQTLTPPYYAKNAPIDDLSELLLIKGVTREMYDPETYGGSNATDHAPSPFQHKLGFGNSPGQSPDYPFGLKDIFTPISSGRVNINTADTNVLQALLGVDGSVAAAIVQQRAGPDGVDGTEDDTPIRNVQSALQSAGVNQRFGSLLTTRSYTFEVHVTAKIGDYSREYIAILYRNPRTPTDIEIFGFHWTEISNSANRPD
jgi:general secretion pathway protein K